MSKENNHNLRQLPKGYGIIPMLPNGMPDITKVVTVETPYGPMLAMPMETHPYLNHFIEKTRKAGYMDESGNFLKNVPKGAWGIWVKMYFDSMNIAADWKYFEIKWGVSNLQQNIMKKNDPKYELWETTFKGLFAP